MQWKMSGRRDRCNVFVCCCCECGDVRRMPIPAASWHERQQAGAALPPAPADLATLVTQCCSAGRLQGALCCSSTLARPPPRASCRSDATFSGRPSYGNVYAAVNAMAGHLNSFGPTAPVPKKRLERMIKVGRVDEPVWLC